MPAPRSPTSLTTRLARLAVALAAICSAVCVVSAQAQTAPLVGVRGWLQFGDGNRLSGVLVARTPGGGVVRTDRFGEVSFQDGDARFEPEPPAARATPQDTPAPPDTGSEWRPATWSIGVSGYWQQKAGSTTSNLELDGDATWRAPRDELRLALSADYKVVDNSVDNNEQSGTLRWLHELHGPWRSLSSLRLERSTASLDPLPTFDYLLV